MYIRLFFLLKTMLGVLKSFYEKSGFGILLSSSFIKMMNLIIIIFIVKLIDQKEYGHIGYAQGILNFIFPFIGFGASQALLQFAGRTKSFKEKNTFFTSSLLYGGGISLTIGVLVVLFSGYLSSNLPLSQTYLIVLSCNFISLFLYDLVKSYSRIIEVNKLYVQIEFVFGITTIILSLILTYFWGSLGYVTALILTPLLVGVYYLILFVKKFNLTISFSKKLSFDFWKYGIYETIGIASAQILFSIDIVNIGNILHSAEDVAGYKIASLIPFSLAVIPNSFITADYIKIVQNRKNKTYLKNLITNYLKIFIIISLSIMSLCFYFSNQILALFKPEYQNYSYVLQILSLSIVGNFVLRIPFSNILTAVKRANINMIISLFILGLNLALNSILINKYGVIGAAFSTTIVIWLYGVLAAAAFFTYYRKL